MIIVLSFVCLFSTITSLRSDLSNLGATNSNLSTENQNYLSENAEFKDKSTFLDDSIVFVLDGYGKYYYTYDQMERVTHGKSYNYWAYNKEQAKSL